MDHDSKQRIDFITPRSGDGDDILTPEQAALAAADFCALVDDILLANADKVDVSANKAAPNTSNLVLRIQLPHSRLSIYVTTEELTVGSLVHNREITITERDGQREIHRSHTYRFTPGMQEVSRSDTYRQPTEVRRLEAEFKDEAYWREQGDAIEHMSLSQLFAVAEEFAEEERANQDMERQMGLNHLPVSSDEIALVSQLVHSAEAV